jgi:hypothetical protein
MKSISEIIKIARSLRHDESLSIGGLRKSLLKYLEKRIASAAGTNI